MLPRPIAFPRAAFAASVALLMSLPSMGLAAPNGRLAGPAITAPAAGESAPEGALRFAWAPPAGSTRHAIVLSQTAFDPSGWRRLPEGEGFRVVRLDHPVASFADLGMTASPGRPVYWAAASSSGSSDPWRFSESRAVTVLPKFTSRMAASPYLETSPIGKAAPLAATEPRRIRLAAGYSIDPKLGEPALPAALRESSTPSTATRTYLVYFGDAAPAEARATIEKAGGHVVSYVPDNAYIVRTSPQAGFALDSREAWVGNFQPAYKLSADVPQADDTQRSMTVMAFSDGDLDAVAATVAAAGGRVVYRTDNALSKILRVELSGRGAVAVAQHPDVAWVEPYVIPTVENASAEWVTQTGVNSNRRIWDMGLHGEGQVFHHSDSGIDTAHEMFNDPAVPILGYGSYPTHRKVIEYDNGSPSPDAAFGDQTSASYHGTHTSCTTAGTKATYVNGDNAGMSRAGKIWHSDLAGPSMGTGLVPPVDLNDLFQPSYTGNAGGAARISTNSWGSPVNGAYTVDSYNVDRFMWNHPDFLVFFSAGNSGSAAGTVGSPGTSKDCVTVGGCRNGLSETQIYSFSSRGPALDGRIKPTIIAPAQSLISAYLPPNQYQALAGTSMASPSAAGSAGLMRQYLTEGWYPTGAKVPANGFTPSAALLKAMLVSSGVTHSMTGFTVGDNNIGFGRICVDSTLFFAGDTKRLVLVDMTNGLAHGQSIEYKVNVVDNQSNLKVALCWTDFPGNPAAAVQLVNNLNLTVTNGVVTYKGNVFASGYSATGGAYDSKNVEEEVWVKFPAPGIWTVRVEGTNVPVGPQPFALAISGGVGANAGGLALDRATYGSSSTVQLRLTDANAAGSQSVTLTSNTEPAGETVSLTGGSGIFTGSLPLSPFSGSAGDGTLQVSHGDVITATYHDANPVANIVQTATVSMYAPIITNVSAVSTGTGLASMTWTTNTNASSRLYYGTTPALGSVSALDPSAVLSHAVSLSGLTSGVTYYFDVESQDLIGNTTRDDNGGQHYRFTARPPGDLLVVYGGQGFERESRYDTALQSLGWFYDTWTGSLSDNPPVGNLSSGMRSYDAVWWQPQLELYPPVGDAARDSIDAYVAGGGRIAVMGHDLGWSNSDPTSDFYSPERQAWVVNTLHATFSNDPPGWSSLFGVAADPISGAYTGGISYAEHRAGASGDEVTATGTGAVGSWNSGDGSPATCAVRWESASPQGTAGNGVWGGKNSRLTSMFFEWSSIDPLNNGASVTRRDVLRKSLAWLLGRDKPTVAVTSPNGGESVTTNTTNVTWTEAFDGAGAGSRTIEYSLDGGVSWNVLTAAAGASPYVWDLTSVPNTTNARVRVRVSDDGSPAFTGYDVSDAAFSIQRPGGDLIGPAVVAGSIQSSPAPIVNASTATLNATVNDALAGGSNIAAAEWSAGPEPAAPGAGIAMSGSFAAPQVAVSATLPSGTFDPGTIKLWVRGRDVAGNWGNASAVDVIVNGSPVASAGNNLPRKIELRPSAPNPVQARTTISFALPSAARVKLAIYDITGRKVRALADGQQAAGVHAIQWDRSDDRGRSVEPGIYFTRLDVNGKAYQQKIVTLR